VENVTTKRCIYRGRIYSDPFPVEHLKRVDRPTIMTFIVSKGGV